MHVDVISDSFCLDFLLLNDLVAIFVNLPREFFWLEWKSSAIGIAGAVFFVFSTRFNESQSTNFSSKLPSSELMIKHFFAKVSKNRRVSPRMLYVCAVNAVFENYDSKSLVKPSIVSLSMKKIFCVAR